MPTLIDSNGEAISLGRELGRGGEGAVWEVLGNSSLVAKVYSRPVAPEKSEKLVAMARAAHPQLEAVAAWPTRTLHRGVRQPLCGFLMPNLADYYPIHKLYSPAHRKQEFPRSDWSFLIHAAANLARAVATVHSFGYVIGDVNQGNFVVSSNATIKLIDCDSIQLHIDGRIYSCEVGVAHFTPPELQTRSFHGTLRTSNHDNFGLAILCFHLLFMGRHPFAGRFKGKGDMPIERAIHEYRFAFGRKAAQYLMEPPPHTLTLQNTSPLVGNLFERAFSQEAASSGNRPAASEWVYALESLERELKTCPAERIHKYHASLSLCPWCNLEKNGGIYFFLGVATFDPAQNNFNVSQIWARIETITLPLQSPYNVLNTVSVKPSPIPRELAIKHALNKAKRWGAGIIAVCIFFSGFMNNIWILLIFFFLLAVAFGGGEGTYASETQRRRDTVRATKEHWESIVRKWENECGDHQFKQKKAHLEQNRNDYISLPSTYQQDRRRLEADKQKAQLRAHLSRYFIDQAKISGIGFNRKATLASYGIETAADVIRQNILRVPGIGPKLANELLAWRARIEARFTYDPSKGVGPADILALDQAYHRKRANLERELMTGLRELTQLRDSIITRRNTLQPEILRSAYAFAQANADLSLIAQ